MDLTPGRQLLHYRLVEKIGEGGMGVVWRAVDTTLDRDVAIKVLPDEVARDAHRLARFEREAKLLASLNHANVATIHGLERAGADRFLVMELVDGRTIADRLAVEGPWKIEDALPIMRQIARGLEAAHAKGIIHRDLKPSNVQITERGEVKILDFGLAKMIADVPAEPISADAPTVARAPTRSGLIVGTMTYMSPEQIEGRSLDARSDLFQLGMVFVEMLTGRHPFHGLTPVDVQHAILREPPQLAQLEQATPEAFVRLVAKLLEKDRDYRYPDAHALGVDLKLVHRDADSGWRSGSSSVIRARPPRRPSWMAVSAVAVTLAALGAVVVWALRDRPVAAPAAIPERLVPLTLTGGENASPSFSPDGNSLVYAANVDGNWDLWVALVSGGNQVRITETPESEYHPVWSPAGGRVAFTRYRFADNRSDIWLIPALGGTPRKVCDDGYDPSWAPDGRRLVFVRDVDGWSQLVVVDVDLPGSERAVLDIEQGVFHRHPTWTADGASILFTRSQGGLSGRLMRVGVDGEAPRAVTDDPEGVSSWHPVASADGRYVVHVSDRGGTNNLWRIPVEGGEPERITSGPGPDDSPTVSSNGRRIAFVNRRADPHVVRISREDGSRTVVAELEGGLAWGPVVSPDGARIALSRKRPGEPWRIVLVARDGGSVSTLLEVPFDTIWPRFHPDGERVLFFTWPGRQRIGAVALDGIGLTWVTGEAEQAGFPSVSPDGSTLAFVRARDADGPSDIVVRPLSGDGGERVVVENATLPAFSPDGRHLAFAGGRSYRGRIGVVDLTTGERRWLTGSGTWPTWMPDGTAIAYAVRAEDGPQVARFVSLDGTRDEPLSDFRWSGTDYTFSIDPGTGDILSTDVREGRARIWLAEYDDD